MPKKKTNLAATLEAGSRYVLDNWQNVFTGLGTSRDKTTHGRFVGLGRVSDSELCALYHQDDIARRVVAEPVIEMHRTGFKVAVDGDPEAGADAVRRLRSLGGIRALKDAAIWARVYGGSVVLIGANDGLPVEERLNERSIKSVDFFEVIDRRYLNRRGREHIEIMGRNGGGSSIVHVSRLIEFGGAHTDTTERERNGGWDHSVITTIYDELRRFNDAWSSASHLISDASQGVFKVSGLMGMIAGGQKANLQTRMELVDMSRSVARSIMLDADEGEDFTRESSSFTDAQSMMDKFMLRMSSAANMPVTRLMGQSPAGMNATGDGDNRLWYDRIEREQEDDLREPAERMMALMLPGQTWSLSFNPLWQPSAKDASTMRREQADADIKYIQAGVVLPEEVALSRFGADGWSGDTTIDREARTESLEVDERTLVQAAEVDTGGAPAQAGKVVLAPTDIAIVVTVDEARASQGLAPWPDREEGALTVAAFKARKEAAETIVGVSEGEAKA